MPTPTTPATLLECLNMILQGARLAPIGSLDQADANEDSAQALRTIHQVNREFQMKGWFFNTVEDKVIDPEMSGEVLLPANTLKVVKSRYKGSYPLTARGLKLYDPRDGGTFILGESATVDLVECLEFDDLSEAARSYVTGLSARRFCIPKLPTQTTFQWTEEYVVGALRMVEHEDTEQRDQTLKDTSPHFAKHQRGKKVRG